MSTDAEAFKIDTPCPRCGRQTVIGFTYVNENGEHMHTHYVCRFWPASDGLKVRPQCGWHGWVVPEPSITCPRCKHRSFNPNDIAQGYCGYCHWWTSDPQLGADWVIAELEREGKITPC